MRRNSWICAGLILVISTLFFVTACQQQVVKPDPPVTPKIEPAAQDPVVENTIEEPETTGPVVEIDDPEPVVDHLLNAFVSEDLYYDFDNDALTPASQEILRSKAQWLRANPDVSILIEGHCDERGTTEYNLALGDRRAESARAFLIDMGISASRMTKISYGEEMPIDAGHTEESWIKNRRAHFTVE